MKELLEKRNDCLAKRNQIINSIELSVVQYREKKILELNESVENYKNHLLETFKNELEVYDDRIKVLTEMISEEMPIIEQPILQNQETEVQEPVVEDVQEPIVEITEEPVEEVIEEPIEIVEEPITEIVEEQSLETIEEPVVEVVQPEIALQEEIPQVEQNQEDLILENVQEEIPQNEEIQEEQIDFVKNEEIISEELKEDLKEIEEPLKVEIIQSINERPGMLTIENPIRE